MTQHDLKQYESIAILIARTFGKGCEVVIHDLSIPQNSVVYCINNHVTGREVGQSFEHLIKQVLLSPDFDSDCTANYFFRTDSGKLIKSSTALIRNDSGKAIGALCVNFDVTGLIPAADFLGELLAINPAPPPAASGEADSVLDIVKDIVTNIIGHRRERLSKAEKMDMVRFMEKKGIFLVKGAIDIVADKLDLSKVTVYSYLNELKRDEPPAM